MERMIEVDRLVKHFGPIVAVDGVSFSLGAGTVLGFLGPNGAGKSTTMKMITGFLTPTSGRVSILGHDVAREPIQAKATIGYLPEGAPAYADMTPSSFLNFTAEVRGLAGAEKRRAIGAAVDKVSLEPVLQQPIDTLSKGFKRRVGLAQAILHDPPVLILDEPTDGLDPNQKHEVRTLIREMAREKAIIISTHILEEVDAVCSRAMIIARGRIVADGTPEELEARSRYYHAVALKTDAEGVEATLAALPEVGGVETLDGNLYHVFPAGPAPIVDAISRRAREAGWRVDHLAVEPGRLDEVFRRITTEDDGDGRPEAQP
jgi:gliding motility-associated transport system ATP-binding protein